jgi:nucleoside-diphosphate-sugar epimerase
MSRVLITGGAGFIGAHVARLMADLGCEVAVADALIRYTDSPVDAAFSYNERYRFDELLRDVAILRCDLIDATSLAGVLADFQPTHVIHLAGMPLANLALRQPFEAFRSITVTTTNLLEALRQKHAQTRLVYVSSSMTYGDFERFPVDESATQQPKEIYGGMKLAGEEIVRVYGQCFSIPFTIIRPCSVYGPGDNNPRVLGLFLRRAIEGQPITVKNADATCLDFSHVDDVARGLCAATFSEQAVGESFNITRGRGRTLREAVDLICREYPHVETEWINGSSFRPNRGALDCSKAERLFGYRPKIDLEDGIPGYARFLEAALQGSRAVINPPQDSNQHHLRVLRAA